MNYIYSVLQFLDLVGIYLVLLTAHLLHLRQMCFVSARSILDLVYPFLELDNLMIKHRLLTLHI